MNVSDLILDAVRREVARQLSEVREVRWGTVETASPLTVTLPGDTATVGVSAVDGFTPTVGATVVLLKVGNRLWAIAERDLT